MTSNALVSVKMIRVAGKSKSSSVDVSVGESEGSVYSSDGSTGDIFEYNGISSKVYDCNQNDSKRIMTRYILDPSPS